MLGCTDKNQQQTQQSSTPAANSATQADTFVSKLPSNAPVLKVATNSEFAPFGFKDNRGNLQGIDIDTMNAIGEKMGYRVEFNDGNWTGVFDRVETGKADVAIAGIAFTTERSKKYALSKPYFFSPSTRAC
ncbi:transporter substrate-binding domain-containing protein [Acinetobacter sp. c1-l78]|uniref:transporter substrate-binding domain-containing protein n=1 Tax=Acinetobacter sp. c1-l78 TaxID=3342803 RepID=UPI0035B7881F